MHYCVANMPGAVARTSNLALIGATLPYCLAIATIAAAHGLEYVPPEAAVSAVKGVQLRN